MHVDLKPHRYKNLKRVTNYTMHLPSLAQCAATIPYFAHSCPLPSTHTHTQNTFGFFLVFLCKCSFLFVLIILVTMIGNYYFKFYFLPSPICILVIKKKSNMYSCIQSLTYS